MSQLSYELAMMRQDELLRQASERRRANEAATSVPAPRAEPDQEAGHLRRFLRLGVAKLRVRAGETSVRLPTAGQQEARWKTSTRR